jgi:hypothetical protein
MAVSGVVAIATVFLTEATSRRAFAMLTEEMAASGYDGWRFAGVVTSCLLPVIVGTIVFRLRRAASLTRAI